jgi:hypothetical protein
VRDGTRAIVARRRSGTAALRAADPQQLTFETPVPVYVLTVGDLTAGRGLAGARPVAWRYAVRDRGKVIATAEAATNDDGTHRFSHVNEGPFVASAVAALAAAGNLPEVRGGLFERRLLEVPALHSVSLWLHDPGTDGNDVVVPLAPAPPGLAPSGPVDAAAFVDALVPLARAVGPGEGLRGSEGS